MKIKDIMCKSILGVLAFIILWIVLQGILDFDTIIYNFNPIILTIGIVIYFFLIRLIYNKLLPKIENNKVLPFVLIGIFAIICIILAQVFKVNPSWDMGEVYKIAVNIVETENPDLFYLYKFPNNVGVTGVYTILFGISNAIGITNYVNVATIFNSIIVIACVILMYLIVRKLYGNKKALMILIISIFTTPLYLYAAIYYSDTLSILFMLLTAYIFIKIKEINQNKKLLKIFGYIFLTLVIFVGMQIKITTFFIVIAYILYKILNGKIKELGRPLLVFVPTFIIIYIIYSLILNNIILPRKDLSNQAKLPTEQWIVMGLQGVGGYNQAEFDYMNQIPTYEEKQNAAREQIKQILSEYDVNSFIKHLTEKLKYAWTDGTYFAPEKLRREPVNNTILHEFVLANGKYSSYYKYLPQVMHLSMLIFILIGACKTIKEKEYEDTNVIFYILMIGFIAFFLIWENRSRYILTCVPFLMIAQLKGIEIFTKYKSRKEDVS